MHKYSGPSRTVVGHTLQFVMIHRETRSLRSATVCRQHTQYPRVKLPHCKNMH